MQTSLRANIEAAAAQFTNAILEAVRSASLEELLGTRAAASHRRGSAGQPARAGRGKPGRLPRRSAEDIARELDRIVALLRKNKSGLRAEQIRVQLGMQAKELPRVLREGVAKKQLRSKGQKRATTYFAT
jgi:hypothetical protein